MRDHVFGSGTIIMMQYELRRQIGEGALSRVFEALDRQSGNSVVIKVYKKDAGTYDRDNEIMMLQLLRGNHAPTLFNQFSIDGNFCIVMEYLGEAISRRGLLELQLNDRIEVAKQLLECISDVHSMGITRGEIKLSDLFWLAKSRRLVILGWENASRLVMNQIELATDTKTAAKTAEAVIQGVMETGTGSTNISPLPAEVPPSVAKIIRWANASNGKTEEPPFAVRFGPALERTEHSPSFELLLGRAFRTECRLRRMRKAILATILVIGAILALVTLLILLR